MSWLKLKELIHKIKPNEFEELVAVLLKSFLKIPFVVARAGEQPSGDARSISGEVSMQAKRYTSDNTPNANQVEGDIRNVIRTLSHLQVYVLAVSRDTAQIRDRIDAISLETGLDIVLLELSDDLSDIGALCITFWEKICHFFDLSDTDQDYLVWIEEMKNDAETKKKLEELKFKLEDGIQTQIHVQRKVEKYLTERFNRNEGFNPIDLTQAIDRGSLQSQITDWWQMQDTSVCYLEGEEGTGKTWFAAKWMNSIGENENIATFWIDSKDWKGSKSIFDLLYNCFSLIYPSSEQAKITKLQNKPAKIWRKTLIVLDGVNERDAIETAQHILNDYFRHNSEWKDRIGFLFTTRPLSDYPDFEKDLWDQCHKISVTPYNDPELQKALSKEGMQLHDLPDSLKDIAKNPRYFQTCIRLRDRFGSFETVTKELVLWVDLLDKIDQTNPQLKQKLGWHKAKDAQEILSELAKQVKWTDDNVPQISVQVLLKFFPNYNEIRHDLEEQRIVLDAGLVHANLSSEHIVLGWALYLSNQIDSEESAEINDLVECLKRALEPIPSEDLRTRALFDALQIMAISPDSDISKKQAALMFTWFNSHNAQITKKHLSVCVENYTDAYCQVVELEFKNQLSPNEEDTLIEPLARVWRTKKGELNDLASRLTKWLLPTYADEVINGDDNINPKSLPFPTMYYTQTRLAIAALSILSQRPECQFLPTLARCYAIHEQKPEFNKNIGRLIRWEYTESILEDLRSLVEQDPSDEHLIKGVYGLASELKQANLHKQLQRPPSEENKERKEFAEKWNSTFKPFIDRIRDQEMLLKDRSPAENVNGNYHGLDYLAARTDLPDLHNADLNSIKKILHYISKNVKLGQGVDASLEDYCIQNLMPWIAKYDAEGYAQLACNLKINTLPQKWAQFKLLSIQGLIFRQEDCQKITEAILKMKKRLVQGEDYYSDVAWLTHLLTESLLFCASEEILIDWFEFLASQEPLRSSICYESLPCLFKKLLPVSIIELAQKKLEEFRTLSQENQIISDEESEEFLEEEYWCALFAYASKHEDRTVKYALEDLKMRKPDSTGTYPMLRLAYSLPKLFLNETQKDENIQNHLFSQNGRKWIIPTYEGNDVPSYESLRSLIPPEFIGSFLCGPDRQDDLSRWGIDLMNCMLSILRRIENDPNVVEDTRYGINRDVIQTWAEQNQNEFLYLSDQYLTELSKSPWYRRDLSDFTDVILCLLLRFQPEKAIKIFQQWRTGNVRTFNYNQYGIETFHAQIWKVEQCNTPQHVQLRHNLLEECQNDEEIMLMTIAAITGRGEKELLDLVEKEYLESHYAKERNLGVSILPWFGTGKAIELLEDLKSIDPSMWVRRHAAWAYEVAQQEHSCREAYREALQNQDLFRISAVFEQLKPALTPTANWWHYQIGKEEGLYNEIQEYDPKFLALVDRFWSRWGNPSDLRRNIKVFGRKLDEFCRGEEFGSGSPPRLAPWWKPD